MVSFYLLCFDKFDNKVKYQFYLPFLWVPNVDRIYVAVHIAEQGVRKMVQ